MIALCSLSPAPPYSHVANKYMRHYHSHSVEQDVEWLYCFDVHSNAFFCSFLLTYVLQVPHLCNCIAYPLL